MLKVHYLGTCSGTEPIKGMHHCSFVIEINDALYWFDAGENCAYAANTSGVDMLKTRALFVSHPHIDHIGGLANLLFCIEKLQIRSGKVLANDNTLDVFFPDLDVFAAIKTVAVGSASSKLEYVINEHKIKDGIIFQDKNLCITAQHNCHMGSTYIDTGWRSFSFLVEADGKRIVFSGDVAKLNELDELIADGVDVLIAETGHHKVIDVCEYANSKNVKNLRFNHHGRAIIENRKENEKLTSEFSLKNNLSIKICYDGMIEDY